MRPMGWSPEVFWTSTPWDFYLATDEPTADGLTSDDVRELRQLLTQARDGGGDA